MHHGSNPNCCLVAAHVQSSASGAVQRPRPMRRMQRTQQLLPGPGAQSHYSSGCSRPSRAVLPAAVTCRQRSPAASPAGHMCPGDSPRADPSQHSMRSGPRAPEATIGQEDQPLAFQQRAAPRFRCRRANYNLLLSLLLLPQGGWPHDHLKYLPAPTRHHQRLASSSPINTPIPSCQQQPLVTNHAKSPSSAAAAVHWLSTTPPATAGFQSSSVASCSARPSVMLSKLLACSMPSRP